MFKKGFETITYTRGFMLFNKSVYGTDGMDDILNNRRRSIKQ